MLRLAAFGLVSLFTASSLAAAPPPAARKKTSLRSERAVLPLKREVTRGSKPRAPIEFFVEPVGGPTQRGQALRVGARPLVPVADFELRVEASEGLTITAGESHWRGRPGLRQPSARVVQVVALGAGAQRVGVTATITLPDGTQMTGHSAWIGRPAKLTLEQEFPGGRAARDRKGRRILELPAEP
jgi:hypothetical protein